MRRLLLPLKKEDFVIAVDGGYEYVKDGRVDLAIGDFVPCIIFRNVKKKSYCSRKRMIRIRFPASKKG